MYKQGNYCQGCTLHPNRVECAGLREELKATWPLPGMHQRWLQATRTHTCMCVPGVRPILCKERVARALIFKALTWHQSALRSQSHQGIPTARSSVGLGGLVGTPPRGPPFLGSASACSRTDTHLGSARRSAPGAPDGQSQTMLTCKAATTEPLSC